MNSYGDLYREIKREFAQSPKSTNIWDEGTAITGRLFYRPMGMILAPLFIKFSFSANQVTLLGFLVGTLGNVLFLVGHRPWFVPAALCLVGFAIIDFTDGLIARHEKKSTYFGKMLDSLAGNLVAAFMAFFVGAGVTRSNSLPTWWENWELYVFLAAMGSIINLANKFVAATYDWTKLIVQGANPPREEKNRKVTSGAGYRLKRVLFHLTSTTAHLVLLLLTLLQWTYLFPLALLLLATLQLIQTLARVFRNGPRELALEKL